MIDDDGALLFAWRGCLFRVADGVQAPKAGSLFFCRSLAVRAGQRVLEIGAGLGLAAVLAARAGARVVATDIVPAAVESIRANAALNGVVVDARLGDCYAPVGSERFDVICSNPPQMPTPPGRERDDSRAAAVHQRARLCQGPAQREIDVQADAQPGVTQWAQRLPIERAIGQ